MILSYSYGIFLKFAFNILFENFNVILLFVYFVYLKRNVLIMSLSTTIRFFSSVFNIMLYNVIVLNV